jgi:hypothetical protein
VREREVEREREREILSLSFSTCKYSKDIRPTGEESNEFNPSPARAIIIPIIEKIIIVLK